MTDSLFHEVYGTYYGIVKEVLRQEAPLTSSQLEKIVQSQGFSETAFQLLPSLKNQRNPWYLLMEDNEEWQSVIQNPPPHIYTNLERRWLKAILADSRITFFLEPKEIDELHEQLQNVAPLFNLTDLTYYDQFNVVDSLAELDQQQKHFKQLLQGIETEEVLAITYQRHQYAPSNTGIFLPFKLEYSPKNNLFRVRAWRLLRKSRFEVTLNLNRIQEIQASHTTRQVEDLPITSRRRQLSVTCVLMDKRDALKRSMLHFADYHKTTQRLDEDTYELTIYYDSNDETELLIRLLSFGPFVTVTNPPAFVEKIKQRIAAQVKFMGNF